LAGKKVKDIQKALGINAGTWERWYYEDRQDFRKNINSFRIERMLSRACDSFDEILELDVTKEVLNEDLLQCVPDPYLLKLKLEASKYVLESFTQPSTPSASLLE